MPKALAHSLIGKLVRSKKPACACSHSMKLVGKCKHLPLLDKADHFVAIPHAEVQAAEFGHETAVDWRPQMREVDYERSSSEAGQRCANCAHARSAGTVCSALRSDPTVSPAARCSLWTGMAKSLRKGPSTGYRAEANSQHKDGFAVRYEEQTLPDYQAIYGYDDALQQDQRERETSIRRRAASDKFSGRYGIHGMPPKPTLRNNVTFVGAKFVIPQRPVKKQQKPSMQAPVMNVSHPKRKPERKSPDMAGKMTRKRKRRKDRQLALLEG
jgi:hypothetical protein